jgi:hypothetical protein
MEDHKLFELIEEAIIQGSIDEEMILYYARLRNLSMDQITELETLLKACKCKSTEKTEECPEAGTIGLNFDTVVHKCIGRKKNCKHLVDAGAFDKLFERWHRTVKDHFGGWEDKNVLLDGEVYDHTHDAKRYNLLLKKVKMRIGSEERDVPKIWASVDPAEYSEVKKEHLSRGDQVTLVGRVEWDEHIHFYHLADITDLKVKR